MISIYVKETIKNIQKNKLMTVVLILFFTFIFSVFSCTLASIITIDKYLTPQNNETYMEYGAYVFEHQEMIFTPIDGMENAFYSTPRYEAYANEIGYFKENDEANKKLIQIFENFFKDTEEAGYYPVMCASNGLNIDIRHREIMKIQNSTYNADEYIENFKKYNTNYEYIAIPEVKSYRVDYNFFKYEKLTFYKGGVPTEEEFYGDNGYIPIIVGYNFKNYYDIGDILVNTDKSLADYFYPEDDESDCCNFKKNYKIVGILSQDSTIIDGNSSLQNFNTYIIAPVMIIPLERIPENEEYSSLRAFITQLHLVNMSFVKVLYKESQTMEVNNYLNTWLRETNNFDLIYSIKNLEQIFTYGQAIMSERNDSYMFLSAVALIFSLISTVIFIVIRFKKNLRDYAVHMMLGATVFDIVMFGVFEVLFLYICSLAAFKILGFRVFAGIFYAYIGAENAFLFVAVGLFCVLVTCVTTLICVKKFKLAETIKGKE